MRPRDFEQIGKIAREVEKMRPTYEQMESIHRQTEGVRRMLSDPAIRKAYLDVQWISEERNRALAQMPDEAVRGNFLEAARYFNSKEFQSHRDAMLQASQVAQQRLGVQGLAAAGRIAARSIAVNRTQEQAVERIQAGHAAELLGEATHLASNPAVRETVERADPDALVRLDEQQHGEVAPEPEIPDESGLIESGPYHANEFPEFTKEDLLEMHAKALLVLWPLEAALATLLLTPTAPLIAQLTIQVGGLIAFVTWSERIISRWED